MINIESLITNTIKDLEVSIETAEKTKSGILKQMSDFELHQAILSQDKSVFEKIIKTYMDSQKNFQTAIYTGDLPKLWQTYFNAILDCYDIEKRIVNWHTVNQRNYDGASIRPMDTVDMDAWHRDIAAVTFDEKKTISTSANKLVPIFITPHHERTMFEVTYRNATGVLVKRQFYYNLADNFVNLTRLVADTEKKYPTVMLANMNFTSQRVKEQIVTRLSVVNREIEACINSIPDLINELTRIREFLEHCISYYTVAINNYFDGVGIEPPSEKDDPTKIDD